MSNTPTNDFYRSTPINLGMTLLDFYRARLLNQIHYVDLYKGVRILKLPEDLRTYERLIEDSKPEVIVELGIESGGSSLWFADRLSSILGGGEVIGVDINTETARNNHRRWRFNYARDNKGCLRCCWWSKGNDY